VSKRRSALLFWAVALPVALAAFLLLVYVGP